MKHGRPILAQHRVSCRWSTPQIKRITSQDPTQSIYASVRSGVRFRFMCRPSPSCRAAEMSEPQSVELVFWESIKVSTRIADYEAYRKQNPGGKFRPLRSLPQLRAGAIRRTATSSCRFGSPCEKATTRPRCNPHHRRSASRR
jgi:hypothetical protein